uniref:Predicted protein n=1 Tax=Hordeum vulgare subsp. vulgare TaxID=112509 RepID=F2E228_HORVV|nr:predicted protein [Hordeum vulgare subsp. vulgare]
MEHPDTHMASPPPLAEDPHLQAVMEVPVTVSLGPMGSLLRKLHSIGPEQCPPDEIRPLKVLCISLKDLSEDEEASITSRWWMKIVRELCYDMEDRLDEVVAGGGLLDFSELLARAKDADERRQRFHWSPHKNMKSADQGGSGVSRLASDIYPVPPVPFCGLSHAGVVEAPNKLVDILDFDSDHKQILKVVHITGCAGVGKTTVARTLIQDHGRKFQCRAFVIVSRNLDMRAFFINMISQLKAPLPPGFPDVPDLIDAVSKHLQGKRYFIVVDDLWTASVWDIICSAFPNGDSSSRVITTTQIDDVAQTCCGYEQDSIYKMEPLSDNESRKLFFGRVFGSEDGCPTDIKPVSYEIIRKCGGLPLAIVHIASLFASESNHVMEKWKHIQDSLSSTSEGMKDVLNLMYKSLPPRLKTCLLYLSMYQQGYVIKKDELVKHWVAEGFLSANGGQDTQEIADGYIDELISRGIIQTVDTDYNGKVLSCSVHQIVLDFLRHRSREENFIITVDYFQSTLSLPDKVRRLSVQFGGVKSAYIPENIVTSHVRSFIFWGYFKCVPCIMDYGLLRVLILHIWADQDKKSFDLTTIGKLFQLKYVKIECNITVKLPTKIRRLQHLGTLQIDARLSAVPSDIVNLKRLLHLRLPSESILPHVVGQLTSLRTLGYFNISSHSEENVLDLGRLTNLQDLQLICSTVQQPEVLERNVQLLSLNLEKFRLLESITLIPDASGSSGVNIPEDSFSMASPPPDLLLHRMELSRCCCIFFGLPKWFGMLKKLSILKIGIRRVSMNDIDMLKGLPGLTALTLYIQTVSEERIVIDECGFQVLTYFKFMCAAQRLSFVQGAMPNVQRLKVGFNSNKMKPHSLGNVGFCHLTCLREVSVKLGVRPDDHVNLKGVESALKIAVKYHPNSPIVCVQFVDVIFQGEEEKSTATQVREGKLPDVSASSGLATDDSDTTYIKKYQSFDRQREMVGMEKYELVQETGLGNIAVIKLMRNRDTRELVAVKFIARGDKIDENVFREIVNHRSLLHPNIIRFKEVVLTPTHLGIVMEYAGGGELFERVCDAGRFHEDEARYFFQQLVCGVSFCHAMQICHRDLKLENTLLDGSPAPRLKICDFRYSMSSVQYIAPKYQNIEHCTRKMYMQSSVLHSRPKSTVGTPAYIAPEVLSQREYDGKHADVWSCGVTLYMMLVGGYPFEDTRHPKNFRKTIAQIMSAQYEIPEYVQISPSCRNLLSRIFIADPSKRITMAEIKAHPWFLKNLPRELKEEAQQAYYNRGHTNDALKYSAQSVEEIMKIVEEAQNVPKPEKLVSRYRWGTGDGKASHNQEGEEEYGEDEYERTVREFHASGDFA